MDPLVKAEREMDQEMRKQIDIYYGCICLALYRHWGWRKKRLMKLQDETMAAWQECGENNERSMLEMLEEETGIDLKNEEGKDWRECLFLNGKHPANKREMTKPQFLYMRMQQTKWVGTMVLGCIMLALHRTYGIGPERIQRLLEQMQEIREENDFKRERIHRICLEETGVDTRRVEGKDE